MTSVGRARASQLLRRPAIAGALIAALILSGCGGNGDAGPDDGDEPTVHAAIVEPADNASDVPTSIELAVSTEQAVETTIELTELDGASIDGEFNEGGDRWLPAGQLAYETTYVATLTAVGENGDNAIATSTFTTMPPPDQSIRVVSFLAGDDVVGVGMPMRIMFWDDSGTAQPVPEEHRAEVERRLSVRSDPPQEGSWHWVNGAEVHYRPQEFWQPGTQIHYRAATGGLPVGDGWYLRNDLNINLTVGSEILLEADADTKQMTVTVDGEVERTIPISLGRQEYPSSSGTFVIMEKDREREFDTREELGDDGYVVDVEYAMRLNHGGEFIHATVRSGEELGADNVTHGCINMQEDNAEWLYDLTHGWGDPVIVEGTSRTADLGNGWSDWNYSWEEYQRGSALHEG